VSAHGERVTEGRTKRRIMWAGVWAIFVLLGLAAARFHLNQWAAHVLANYPQG